MPTESSYPQKFIKGQGQGQENVNTARGRFGKPPPLDFAGQPLPSGIKLVPEPPATDNKAAVPNTAGTGSTKTAHKYSFATAFAYVNTHVIEPITTESSHLFQRIQNAVGYGTK